MKLFICFLLVLSNLFSNDFISPESLEDAYQNEDTEYIFNACENEDTAECEYYLANFYYLGNGVEQDFSKAFQLFKQSSDKGYASAQLGLGYMYEVGEGTEINKELAYKYYLLSSNQGNFKAKENLSYFCKSNLSLCTKF